MALPCVDSVLYADVNALVIIYALGHTAGGVTRDRSLSLNFTLRYAALTDIITFSEK